MITAFVTLTSRPGKHEELLEVLTAYSDHVRCEPGTLMFQLFTDADRPQVVTALEVYADEDALEAHSRSSERAALGRRMDELVESSSLSWLEVLAGFGLPASP